MCSNVLACPLCCHPNFSSVESLRMSLINVTNRPLACPICNEILLGLDKLTIHLFSHTIVCENIEEEKLRSNLDSLKAVRRHKPIKADICVYQETDLQNISTLTTPDEPQCDICGSTFRSQELHQMHMKLVHEISSDNCSNNPDERQHKNRFQCHLCSKYFKMKGSLRVHLRVVHLFGATSIRNSSYKLGICENINRISDKISIAHGQSTKDASSEYGEISLSSVNNLHYTDNKIATAVSFETKLWECDICTKSFTTKYFLKKHKRLHTGEMPYTCEICGKTFTFQQSYHKHLLYHNDDKPHICTTCGRAFKELSTLHNHERIHSGEKPFKCETCDKCFRQRVSYLVHRRIHTGAMPYKCTACEKSFRYKVSQRTHKCLAQPPGTVVRQTSDLLHRLIQSSALNISGEESDRTKIPSEEFSNQSLDELVEESCHKMGIGHFVDNVNSPVDVQIPSPSDKFQNLCLYSPTPTETYTTNSLETINETSFKQLLYGNTENII